MCGGIYDGGNDNQMLYNAFSMRNMLLMLPKKVFTISCSG
jgi:hypothetical protein